VLCYGSRLTQRHTSWYSSMQKSARTFCIQMFRRIVLFWLNYEKSNTTLTMAVLWVLAPWGLVKVYRRFRGACCLHESRRYSPEDNHLHTHSREKLKSQNTFITVPNGGAKYHQSAAARTKQWRIQTVVLNTSRLLRLLPRKKELNRPRIQSHFHCKVHRMFTKTSTQRLIHTTACY
jgi:hypothetical protein